MALTACAVAAAFVTGCSDREEPPRMLADGSRALQPHVELEGVSQPAVSTTAGVRHARTQPAASLAASCLRAHSPAVPAGRAIVERVGVDGTSVTFASASGLHGCDDGLREAGRRWCGIAFGILRRGRLDDPRLDIAACRTASGEPIGFVWITAGTETRYVAVAQDGYAEVYEPAGSLPIRISTSAGVEVDGSRATFRISEHDARGRLLRRYELDAVPAG